MIKMKKLNILALAGVIAFGSGCQDKFDEYNENKNKLSDVNINYELANITEGLENNFDFMSQVTGEYTEQYAWGYGQTPLYEYEGRNDKLWSNIYSKLATINDVIERTAEAETSLNKAQNAVAKVCKVYNMSLLTDVYGDVPYFEAGTGNFKPVYDSQQAIYNDFFKLLDEATATLSSSEVFNLGDKDRVYGGDMTKWNKFANSLRLRLAMHVRFVDASLAQAQASKAISAGVFAAGDDSGTLQNSATNSGYKNDAALFKETVADLRVGKFFVDLLKSTSDPRLERLVDPNEDGVYEGYPNGSRIAASTDFSGPGPELGLWDKPDQILMFHEVCFLKAEAYLTGVGATKNEATANEEYRKGIEASMLWWNVPADQIATYLDGANGNLTGDAENKLKMIATEKYVSLFSGGHEVYTEMRRLGYPQLAQRTDDINFGLGETNGVMPRRCKYPEDESRYNTDNYDAAVAATNNNSFMHKVWWDTK
ncbi:SusD/RagB family nutrient-binding outer membrane lipoprotein [Puteibacter caeruleilacunae]|nr:SusD/RagB family nutrient-binding outer membrane lipoprotein [Puteibacter caeruleilacunae]